MIEDQLPDRFRAVLGDEPPLGFNPDEVVDRAARLHQRRTTAIAASAAAATVVLAAVTALQVLRADDAEVAGFGSAATSEPTKPTCEPKPKPTGTKPTGRQTGTKPSDPKPTGTKPSDPRPTGTRPTEPTRPEPSEPEATETKPKPTGTRPKPTVTKPADPCATKPKDEVKEEVDGFPGWEAPAADLEKLGLVALAAHVPGVEFEAFGVKAYPDVRCLAGFFMAAPANERGISLTVCHDEKAGLDGAALTGGHWGAPVSDMTQADGSHVRVYRFDKGENQGGLAVLHQRPDGVVVQADTGAKVSRADPADFTEEQLTALATDGRLTF